MMDGGGDGHSENSMGETFFQAAGGQIEGKESVFLVTILQF
jgi:hypothetical protein